MSQALLLIGGNIGDRLQYLEKAIEFIGQEIGKVNLVSSVYETEPWGFECEQAFLNQVIGVETKLQPRQILEFILNIEKKMGRKRIDSAYEARPIDIDILMFDDIIYHDSKLQIPHPRMHQRKFTLIPLSEIAGHKIHPVLNKTINELNSICADTLNVTKFSASVGHEI